MKKYWSFFKIRFINGLQYRIAAYAGISTQFFWGGMTVLLYHAFYKADPSSFPMEFSELTTYIWLQQATLAMFNMWSWDAEIFDSIASGNVSYDLARPADVYGMWFAKVSAVRLSRVALRFFPILIVAAFLPFPYGITLPASFAGFLFFLLTLTLAFLNVIVFSMLVYIGAFYTLNSLGIRIVAMSVSEFLSGGIIPLPFLPEGVRKIMELLPFASMQNIPYRVYSGNLAGSELAAGVLLQVLWLLVMLAAGRLWMKKVLRRVVIQGG